MKNKIYKKSIIYTLIGSMLLGNTMPALAANSIEDVEYQNIIEDNTSQTSVYAELGSEFKVIIPKKLTLDGSTKTGSYTVTCEGDIAGYETLKVVPDNSFVLSSANLNDVTATITQDKTEWSYDEILTDNKIIGNGSINAAGISAGSWNGSFNFNICLENQLNQDIEINVTAKDSNNNDLNATATNINGERKEQLLSSLEETGYISNSDEIDALINVQSDEYNNIAHTTFDVSNLYEDGETIVILHFNEETQEWEYIGTDVVENGQVEGDFTSYSPVAFAKVTNNTLIENIICYNYRNTKAENVFYSTSYYNDKHLFIAWCASTYSGYLGYDFEEETKITKVTFQIGRPRALALYGSNNKASWTKLDSCSSTINSTSQTQLITLENNSGVYYRYYKIEVGNYSQWASFSDLKFYE